MDGKLHEGAHHSNDEVRLDVWNVSNLNAFRGPAEMIKLQRTFVHKPVESGQRFPADDAGQVEGDSRVFDDEDAQYEIEIAHRLNGQAE